MKKTILLSVVIGFSVLCFAFIPDGKKPWNVPPAAASKANPQKGP